MVWPIDGASGKSFLTGHTHLIGTIAISPSGKYLITGETHQVGTKVKRKQSMAKQKPEVIKSKKSRGFDFPSLFSLLQSCQKINSIYA